MIGEAADQEALTSAAPPTVVLTLKSTYTVPDQYWPVVFRFG